MIELPRAPWNGRVPYVPGSWDLPRYQPPWCRDLATIDLAIIVCPRGHATRMSASVHRVGPSGVVSPSYVCTVTGCRWHVFLRLVGWPG